MIEVKFEDLRRFEKFLIMLSKFSTRLRKLLNDVLFELIEDTAKQLKSAILENRPELIETRFRRISPDWVKEKVRRGWRPEQLIQIGQYVNAIFTKHESDVHSVLLPSSNYPDHNFSYIDLGNWLETGTRTMKPIPHWGPTKKWFLEQFRLRVRKEVVHALFRR